MSEFCPLVIRNRGLYGISIDPCYTAQKSLILDAWIITARGEVMVFNPRFLATDQGYRETYMVGSVTGDGSFYRKSQHLCQGGMAGPTYTPGPNYFWRSSGRVYRSNNYLTVYANNGRKYIHAGYDEQKVMEIYTAVKTCLGHNLRYLPDTVVEEEYYHRGGGAAVGAVPPAPYPGGAAYPPPVGPNGGPGYQGQGPAMDPSQPMDPNQVK